MHVVRSKGAAGPGGHAHSVGASSMSTLVPRTRASSTSLTPAASAFEANVDGPDIMGIGAYRPDPGLGKVGAVAETTWPGW